jgi:hypothetical protein
LYCSKPLAPRRLLPPRLLPPRVTMPLPLSSLAHPRRSSLSFCLGLLYGHQRSMSGGSAIQE